MRILVVDDDDDFRHLAKRALEARGHTVDVAPSAFGLVNRVAGATGESPHIVVLDCEMPGLSGAAVIELLARDRRTAKVPVLLVSAGEGERHRAARAAHPLAAFHKKDGHMRTFADEVEHHATVVDYAPVKS